MKSKAETPIILDDQTLRSLEQLSFLMDSAFQIPGTNIRFGIDAVLGLLPVIGDTLAVAVSGYIYSFAKKAGVPWYHRARMIWNIFIDWFIGIIPFLGDLFDVAFKANSKNMRIILAHAKKQANADVIDGQFERLD